MRYLTISEFFLWSKFALLIIANNSHDYIFVVLMNMNWSIRYWLSLNFSFLRMKSRIRKIDDVERNKIYRTRILGITGIIDTCFQILRKSHGSCFSCLKFHSKNRYVKVEFARERFREMCVTTFG